MRYLGIEDKEVYELLLATHLTLQRHFACFTKNRVSKGGETRFRILSKQGRSWKCRCSVKAGQLLKSNVLASLILRV